MRVKGFDAKHFLESAVTLVDESGDPDLCPNAAEQNRYLTLALIDALIGVGLAIASVTRSES